MLPFKIHRFRIGRAHFLLLPKLNRVQMLKISDRFASLGYSVRLSRSLSARSSSGAVHVDPSGICWSAGGMDDSMIPAIPSILASEKEKVPARELKSLYFTLGRSANCVRARVSARLESYSNWERLRASGACALSPDEHAVACFLLGRGTGVSGVLTDFPVHESATRFFGGRRYHDSELDCLRAGSTLRVAGSKSRRNSYLHRDGVLELGHFDRPSAEDWKELFGRLGEWCYFVPL